VIEELRQMGNEALTAWAERGVEKSAALAQAEPDWRPGGKKTRVANLARVSKAVSRLDTRVEERPHGQNHATSATDTNAGIDLSEPALSSASVPAGSRYLSPGAGRTLGQAKFATLVFLAHDPRYRGKSGQFVAVQ